MLVKLAYAMQRLNKYLKKFVMINKDGGKQFLDFVGGGHNCYEGGIIAHGEVLPVGKTLIDPLKTTCSRQFAISMPEVTSNHLAYLWFMIMISPKTFH